MMQSVGRRYVQYFNYQYQRSGTLREGRYQSCLVQSVPYLLEVYRYIELNLVRTNMVEDPGEYIWSSYQINALGKVSKLCKPHLEYMKFGERKGDRMERYRELFSRHVEEKLLTEIREGLNKGIALGNERFKEEVEALTGRRLKPKKVGRPIGWCKKKPDD